MNKLESPIHTSSGVLVVTVVASVVSAAPVVASVVPEPPEPSDTSGGSVPEPSGMVVGGSVPDPSGMVVGGSVPDPSGFHPEPPGRRFSGVSGSSVVVCTGAAVVVVVCTGAAVVVEEPPMRLSTGRVTGGMVGVITQMRHVVWQKVSA